MSGSLDYNKLAKGYNELYSEEQLKKVKLIIKLLKIKNESVLDVGCGTALYSNLFKKYIGIDNSKEMLKKAKAKVIFGNAEKLPFKNKSFDTVISITAIHNFKDSKKAISEMKRVAKKKIAISVLKKSRKFKSIEKQLEDFKKFEQEKDVIFVKIF
jgi:demethylmenaquinone methyltransferase/2-methoxy-6-polyprenyl-1,4-benzoquinol methylase